MHQFGWLSERGGNFLNLLQKEGGTQKGGVSQKRGGGPNLEETMNIFAIKSSVIHVWLGSKYASEMTDTTNHWQNSNFLTQNKWNIIFLRAYVKIALVSPHYKLTRELRTSTASKYLQLNSSCMRGFKNSTNKEQWKAKIKFTDLEFFIRKVAVN